MPKLKSIAGELVGRDFAVGDEPLIIGRRPSNAIVLEHNKSSRSHAEVGCKKGRVYVRDLQSSNGTFLNGIKVDPAAPRFLQAGDEIRVATTILRYFDREVTLPDVEIPGHELEEVVAQGGMGTVYRARQVNMDRPVAVKILNADYAKRKEFVNRFIQEARSAGKLNHPNIIHVHNVGKADDCYYFTMELIHGKNLTQRMAEPESLDPVAILEAGARVADALEYAHERGIIHRDVKPDNIILADNGEVKLADLGIATSLTLDEENNPRRVLGTPHYMSPEQASGKPIDGRSDLYSLGATLYHALAHAPVFDAPRSKEVLAKHLREQPVPLAEAAPEIPEAVGRVVDRLLAKDPAKRYATAAEARDALEEARTLMQDELKTKTDPKSKVQTPRQAAAARAKGGGTQRNRVPGRRAGGRTGGTRPSAQGDKKEWVAKASLGGGVALLLVIAYFLLSGGEKDTGPKGPTLEELLKKAEIAAIEQNWDEAIRRYQKVAETFPDDKKAVAETERRIEEIRATQAAEKRTATMEKAWETLQARRDELSRSFLERELASLEKTYPELADRVAEVRTQLEEEKAGEDAVIALRQDVNQRLAEDDYQGAFARIDTFRGEHADLVEKADVGQLRAQIAAKAQETFETHKAQVAELVAQNHYGPALTAHRTFRERIRHPGIDQDVRKLEQDLLGELRGKMDALKAELRGILLHRKFEEAMNAIRGEALAFRGTPLEEDLNRFETVVKGLAQLHAHVVEAIRQSKPWTLPESFELPNLKAQKNRAITGADSRAVQISLGAIKTKVLWDDLDPEQVLVIYRHYVPPGAEADQKFLQLYARMLRPE